MPRLWPLISYLEAGYRADHPKKGARNPKSIRRHRPRRGEKPLLFGGMAGWAICLMRVEFRDIYGQIK